MKVLAIETSCDETAVAIISDENGPGRSWVCANVVASQEEIHARYGGVIPELASRRHIEILPTLVDEALTQAMVKLIDLDGIAVTNRPGLMGALLVGVSYAKALAYASGLPLVGVHHLAGHLAAILLDGEEITWPHLGLVVSGGHTNLFLGGADRRVKWLAQTRDDAAGEAFDKVAKMMNLGFPGGPRMERLAREFRQDRAPGITLPRIRLKGEELGFSFSGLKTAVRQVLHDQPNVSLPELAYVFQERVLDTLAEVVIKAIRQFRPKALIFCGGVAANKRLREGLRDLCLREGIGFQVPAFSYCTDNAAMIGAAGILQLKAGERDGLSLHADPSPTEPVENLLGAYP